MFRAPTGTTFTIPIWVPIDQLTLVEQQQLQLPPPIPIQEHEQKDDVAVVAAVDTTTSTTTTATSAVLPTAVVVTTTNATNMTKSTITSNSKAKEKLVEHISVARVRPRTSKGITDLLLPLSSCI